MGFQSCLDVQDGCHQEYSGYCSQAPGATLMYLAGIDLYDIMKVTGHAPPKMLKKYIKADSLEVVQKLTDKYG